MRVLIERQVFEKINEFSLAAMRNHPLLSRETIERRIQLLQQGLETLRDIQDFRKARLKQEWIMREWHEFVCEGFVFAYEVCEDEASHERFVWVRDVIHGTNYR